MTDQRTPEEIEATRERNLLLSEAEEAAWVGQKPLWWLSFVDDTIDVPVEEQHPGGRSFLGVAMVEAVTAVGATRAAWAHGCNPGGQVALTGPFEPGSVDAKWMYRLLSFEQVEEFNREHSEVDGVETE